MGFSKRHFFVRFGTVEKGLEEIAGIVLISRILEGPGGGDYF